MWEACSKRICLAVCRSTLASASADKTVKVWDVTTQQCVHTLTHHTDKVQSVRWHPTNHTMMLTGSFDKTAAVLDAATVRVMMHESTSCPFLSLPRLTDK